MSKSNRNHKNYSIYDDMSTKMLEEILKSDFQMSDNEISDIDTILYIMEVISKRKKEYPTEEFTEVNTAWESFTNNYLPYLENDKSLYDDEGIEEPIKIKLISPINLSFSWKKIRLPLIVYRTVIIAVLIFFTGTVTTRAFGFDIWDAVAKWTGDVFGFSTVITNKEEPDDLKEILDKYAINTRVTPTWFPDGYFFESVDVVETPLRTTIHSVYSSQNDEISVTIVSLVNPSSSTYEKDSENVITYSANKIEHYIMKNLERTKVIWMIDNYECSITGNFSIKEAEKMINSIYRR